MSWYGSAIQYQNPNIAGSQMPMDFGAEDYARRTRAWLAREEWADYQRRFQPVERELIDAVTGPQLLDQRLAAIRVNNSQAFEAAAQMQGMLQQRYGITPSAQQKAVTDNSMALARTRSEIDATNNTRTHIYDRDMAALGGGAPRADIRSSYEGN